MTDEVLGFIGLAAIAAILAFVGLWFGWTMVLWILGGVGAMLLIARAAARFRRAGHGG